jgi:hypothetical protein
MHFIFLHFSAFFSLFSLRFSVFSYVNTQYHFLTQYIMLFSKSISLIEPVIKTFNQLTMISGSLVILLFLINIKLGFIFISYYSVIKYFFFLVCLFSLKKYLVRFLTWYENAIKNQEISIKIAKKFENRPKFAILLIVLYSMEKIRKDNINIYQKNFDIYKMQMEAWHKNTRTPLPEAPKP